MHPVLNKNGYFIKEHVGFFKAANNYDISDLDTKDSLLECREPNLGFFTKFFRFTKYKHFTAFDIHVTHQGQTIINIKRGVTFVRSLIHVYDENGVHIGSLKRVFRIFKPTFELLSPSGEKMAELTGDFVAWDFKIVGADGSMLANVNKKWAGFGKEMFTTADNYACVIEPSVRANDPIRIMLIASVMCIDMVLKEN